MTDCTAQRLLEEEAAGKALCVWRGSFGEAQLGSAAGTAQLSMLPGPGPVTGSVCSQ